MYATLLPAVSTIVRVSPARTAPLKVIVADAGIDGLVCSIPDGAFYVFPSCSGLYGRLTPDGRTLNTDTDVVEYFLDVAGVALVPGQAFGTPGYFRVSYAADINIVMSACERIQFACEKLIEKAS